MPRTPDDMMSAVSQSLAARTGRSLQEWLTLVQASGLDPLDQNAVRGWLKREYGVPQNSQWAIADAAARSAGWVPPTVEEYLDRLYAGAKAALRPSSGPGQATHKLSLRNAGEVDGEVLNLLHAAYEQNA
jgi:Domain of unknown function (DUF4287)